MQRFGHHAFVEQTGIVKRYARAWGDRWLPAAQGLAGIIAVAYLTYLEVFVIGAICVWCVSYALTIAAGFVLTAVAAFRTSD